VCVEPGGYFFLEPSCKVSFQVVADNIVLLDLLNAQFLKGVRNISKHVNTNEYLTGEAYVCVLQFEYLFGHLPVEASRAMCNRWSAIIPFCVFATIEGTS